MARQGVALGQTTSAEATPTPPASGTQLAIRMGGSPDGTGGVVVSTRLRLVPIALLLAAAHALLSWWRLSRSWFWQDDLNMLSAAADRSLGGLLFSNYNGHLVPGSWLAAWLSDRVAPLGWGFAAALVLLLVVATDLALLAALVRLFGDRPAVLLPYAMFCATSLTLTSTVWWAAALQWTPTCLALALALYFHTGFVERPNRRDLLGSLGALALGLFFFEKALIIPVVLAVLTVAYFVPGPLWKRPWEGFRRFAGYWLALGLLSGGYLWLYLSRATITSGNDYEAGDVVELARFMILETLLPSLAGGPLEWYTTPETTFVSWADSPAWLSWSVWVLTAAAVLGSVVLRRGAWRAWAVLGVFLAISVVLVARARLGFFGSFIGRDHRYLTDAALLAPVCLALAWIPLRPGLDRALPAETEPATHSATDAATDAAIDPATDSGAPRAARGRRAALRRWRASAVEWAGAWSREHRALSLLAGAIAVAVVTGGGIVSSEQYMKTWERNPAPAYFDNLRADLAQTTPKPVFMFDQPIPPLIMMPSFGEDRMLRNVSRVLADDRPLFGEWSTRFSVVDGEGHVRPGKVDGPTAVPAGGITCSNARAPRQGVRLVMPAPPPEWNWKIEISYSAERDTAARVQYGTGPKVPVQLRRGLNVIYVNTYGAGPNVSVTDLDQGATVCIGKVVVGHPVAAPDEDKPPT